MKVGDSATVALKLQTAAGAALTYANLAAFTSAGWAIESTILGAAVSLTVASLVPDPATSALSSFDGTHLLTFTVPAAGALLLRPYNASTAVMSAYDLLVVAGIADTDSIAAQLNAGLGTLISGGSVSTVNDLNWVEGDGLEASFTVPVAALRIFDLANKLIYSFASLADVSATAWTIAAQARYITEGGQLPSIPVAFSFQAAVLDKVNNVVGIGWETPPAGAVIDDLLPSAPTVTVSGGAVTGTTGGTGGHIYGSNAVTVSLGGPGTGAVLTALIKNGQITGYTVTSPGSGYSSAPAATLTVASDGSVTTRRFAYDIQLIPPSASPYTGTKLTVITGFINALRQQTTTP